MRRPDDDQLDPQVAAELRAIDAALAGEPVDPRFAEVAELALLVRDDRPAADSSFMASLDERVARGFAPAGHRRTRWALSPAWGGGLVAAVAAVVLVVALIPGGSSRSSLRPSSVALPAPAGEATSKPARVTSSKVPARHGNTTTTSAQTATVPPLQSSGPSSGIYYPPTATGTATSTTTVATQSAPLSASSGPSQTSKLCPPAGGSPTTTASPTGSTSSTGVASPTGTTSPTGTGTHKSSCHR
jgi:hypothetical protein